MRRGFVFAGPQPEPPGTPPSLTANRWGELAGGDSQLLASIDRVLAEDLEYFGEAREFISMDR